MATVYRRNKSKVWWARFQLNGIRIQRSTRTTNRNDAMKILLEMMEEEKQKQEGTFKKVRFDVLCSEYCIHHLPTLKSGTQGNYLIYIRSLKGYFGDRYIDEIRKNDLSNYISFLNMRMIKTPTIRRYLATFSSMISFAERSGWISENLLIRYDKRSLPEALPRVRFLTSMEYDRLVDAANNHIKPIIQIAVATGMRKDEILSLEWSQLDLGRKEVYLRNTKSNHPRIVPITKATVAIFDAIGGKHLQKHVFTNPSTGTRYSSIKKSFRTACANAEITDFRFHDLRHTFASWAVQNGMDLYRLSKVLGHSSLQMTTRYAHLATNELHDAMEEMATKMATRA